ncbi:MAG TPA: adenosylcobinamide-phosphate synthase CbiB [Candidatus Sulfotelmatobacter sp.]|nr:adenosylcobinamide-phosphate synthase CbiB [Candidatus Sulfotelmatobacter sp.]
MRILLVELYRPNAVVLGAAVVLDLLFGDPVYPLHPIRLMGRTLSWLEGGLRSIGADGYAGGIALFFLLGFIWVDGTIVVLVAAGVLSWKLLFVIEIFLTYSCLALRDLLKHSWAVETAARAGDLAGARVAIARLVGRDTDRMDLAACRRAAIESLSENLTDGFTSAIAWYIVSGLPGLVLFKVVSTMDSMVGNKTPRYLRFGWCGARLDDVMNFVPARLTWILISVVAVFVPRCSAAKAFRVGWRQHAILPGPNSGWSEAATAGGIQRRLIGPIWMSGQMVTDVWVGDAGDAAAGEDERDVWRASVLVCATGLVFAAIGVGVAGIWMGWWV